MEIVVMLFILVGGSIAYSAWKKNRSPERIQPVNNTIERNNEASDRTCLRCGYEGEMKTWIANYIVPKLILVAGFLLGYIPGLIFLVIYWGKYKCQKCGSIGKNQPINAENISQP